MTLDRKIKWLVGLIILAFVVIMLVVALRAFETALPKPPFKPMPNPNGYGDFAKAGMMLSGRAIDFPTMTQDKLAPLVAANAEALKLLRVGINRECRVPDDYSRDYIKRVLFFGLGSQKELAINLCAEGRLAKMQNRTIDAAQSYLDAESFGIQCSQGGVMISKLVGIACETLGREGLRSLTNNLNSQECRKVAQVLETVNDKETPLNEILERENAFEHKTMTLQQKIAALISYKEQQQSKARFLAKYQKNKLARRQMMIDFAARAYEMEKGKPPTVITDLVPDYLKAIPKDPFTGSNLVLHASAP